MKSNLLSRQTFFIKCSPSSTNLPSLLQARKFVNHFKWPPNSHLNARTLPNSQGMQLVKEILVSTSTSSRELRVLLNAQRKY
eukprot:2598810-Amphidinium_carterae.1